MHMCSQYLQPPMCLAAKPPANDHTQGPRMDQEIFKGEVKALPMQPAHPLWRMEQVYLPMIRGKAGPYC